MLYEQSFKVPKFDRYTAHKMVEFEIKNTPSAPTYRWGFHDDGWATVRCPEAIEGWAPTTIPPTDTVVTFVINVHIRCWVGGDTVPKRRVSNVDYASNMDWMEKRAESMGLELVNLDVNTIKAFIARPPTPFIMEASRFNGVAKISNPAKVEKIMIDGIGNAKAFGFGFLLVSPWEV